MKFLLIKLIRKKPFIKSYKINSHLHLFESIKQDLIDEKPDLIFGHDLGTFDNLVLLKIKKTRVLCTIYDNLFQ